MSDSDDVQVGHYELIPNAEDQDRKDLMKILGIDSTLSEDAQRRILKNMMDPFYMNAEMNAVYSFFEFLFKVGVCPDWVVNEAFVNRFAKTMPVGMPMIGDTQRMFNKITTKLKKDGLLK